MTGLYARWINRWETKLATRDNNRMVRPFEWGLDWLPDAPLDPSGLAAYLANHKAQSDQFFSYRTPSDFSISEGRLTFTSAIETPYPENNRVLARFFPVSGPRRRAVIVLPQWNSDAGGHIGLCKLLNKFGLSALRMSMAYHDERMPAELQRADYHVSSNIGRTIGATRQSIIDVRSCIDWLQQQGYERIAILGSSLGSCIAFIAAAHDPRLKAGVFNHISTYVSDVVWTGISTRHVRQGFEGSVTQDELRQYWSIISPATYMDRMKVRNLKSLLVWARYDTTFLPEFSIQVLERFRELNLPHKVKELPCAHYTTGQFPFNWIDGIAMCRFLYSEL
jgi:hypothetical protein